MRGLSKRFGAVTAVDHIDLTVEAGQFVTLLGPSGSGKTTTLRAIAGLEQPDEGTIHIGERLVNGPGVNVPPHQRDLGMVFQSYAIWPHKNVYENVAFPLRQRRLRRGEEHGRVMKVLETVGLGIYHRRYPSELSGGQQQRVALARALVGDPEVILYDEPLSNLDAKLRESMRLTLHTLHQQLGVTAVYVTHDQLEAMVLSDRVYVMNQGRIEQVGTPMELYDRPASLFVAEFIGQANILPIAELDPERQQVRLDAGPRLRVAGLGGAPAADAPGKKLVIRPHKVRFQRTGNGAGPDPARNVLAGKVLELIFLGDRVRYTVEIAPDCRLVSEQVSDPGLPGRGDAVLVELPPDSCVVI
jgi:ABC-type Fe3+/spermidine/putrescine transport system ATPase subunit